VEVDCGEIGSKRSGSLRFNPTAKAEDRCEGNRFPKNTAVLQVGLPIYTIAAGSNRRSTLSDHELLLRA
jgi:hypothetical protein